MADQQNIVSTFHDVSKLTSEKYCVLPGQFFIRCSTTEGGHTVVITNKPAQIPVIFKQTALGKGAITETMLERIKASASVDTDVPVAETLSTIPNSTPGMNAGVRFTKIKQALLPMLKAGDPKDFTAQGIPQVASLSAACGFDVTGAERDAAFSELKDSPELD